MLRRIRYEQSGLSLLETLVALTVFLIVSLGVTPLMMTAMRGATLSRSTTVGKNISVEAMERVRGLPYFVSVQGQTTPQRRDVLDLYFPDKVSEGAVGYQAGSFSYATKCSNASKTPAASGAAACPKSLPEGTSVTYTATFVEPDTTVTPETFTALEPVNGYSWAATATEAPTAGLLRMVIDVAWPVGGKTRSTKLTTILGERTVSPVQVQAEGNVRFAVQASTSYEDESTLRATAGISESKIENKQVAAADHTTRVGRLLITDESDDELDNVSGAISAVHAPPNQPVFNVSEAPQPAVHPRLPGSPTVGYLGGTLVDNQTVEVINELPKASGRFQFMGGSGAEAFWVHSDVGALGADELLLDANAHILELNRLNSAKITGESSAEATSLSPAASRMVVGYAQAKFGRLDLLPAALGGATRPVVYIENFEAWVKCTSTATQATASATGSWKATLRYWTAANSYQTINLTGSTTSTATDPLAAVRAQNPRVYEDPADPAKDLYLFETGSVRGYLKNWSSRPQIEWSKDDTGRITTASLDGALEISTAPVNPQVPNSGVGLSIGSLSCQAEDRRGL